MLTVVVPNAQFESLSKDCLTMAVFRTETMEDLLWTVSQTLEMKNELTQNNARLQKNGYSRRQRPNKIR